MRYVYLLIIIALASGCTKWEEHYSAPEGSVNVNVWESIRESDKFNRFVLMMEKYLMDTIFETNNSYTLFIPSDAGFDSLNMESLDPETFLLSHISETVFLARNIDGYRKLKTLSGKYAVLEEKEGEYYFNSTKIAAQSEQYGNGIYYTLNGASRPLDNLFQYVERINPLIAGYIREQDSVYLDLNLSKAIDVNENGEIIYDSVMVSVNLFELLYFPLSREFRDNKATMAIPNIEQYNHALDSIKINLDLDSAFEIPLSWQYNVLMPFILEHGIFEGTVPADTFRNEKLKNITGDSVVISYNPVSATELSNGIIYEYDHFSIPDSLYLEGNRLEGESLVTAKGLDLFAWKDSSVVKIAGNSSFAPVVQKVKDIASNDSVLYVDFGKNFTGNYSIEFKMKNIFPGHYQFIWRSNPRSAGIYSVYINDELQTLPFNLTEFDLKYLSGGVVSVTGEEYFYPQDGYNKLDALTTIDQYGDVEVRIEYIGPGDTQDNGLIIDYVELIPYKQK